MENTSKSRHSDACDGARPGERGSTILIASFVLALLTGMALILMFASNTEVKMSHADGEAKKAFYLAEAATESGREELRRDLVLAVSGVLTPHLAAAAGVNGNIDFNADNVRPILKNGVLVGFSGVGDDAPILAPTAIGDGWYAAFITNDAADGLTSTTDTNEFAMISGLGVSRTGAFEMAQLIVKPGAIFPPLPAAITLLGPKPELKHGSGKGWAGIECPEYPDKDDYLGQKIKGSKIWADGALIKADKVYKTYNGTDCGPRRKLGPVVGVGSKLYASLVDVGGGGIPGMFTPTYGGVGKQAEMWIEKEMAGSKIDYLSDQSGVRTGVIRPAEPVGNYQGEDTIADLTDPTDATVIGSGLGPLNATWSNCNAVKAIVEKLRDDANYVCTPPGCSLPAMTPSTLAFIDGDFRVDCAYEGRGMLVVTGELDFPASSSWTGIIFVVGEGKFYRVKKDGFGNISGGTVVADIAGPDDIYGTADDCTGGTGGFDSVYYEEQKKVHRGTTVYCSDDIAAADPGFHDPMVVESFRQR